MKHAAPQHRTIALRIVRTMGVLTLIPLVAWAFVCGIILLQGSRDEAQRVDAIVVVYPGVSNSAYLDHGIELYRQGYAPRLLLAGEQATEMQETLLKRGIPDAALLNVDIEEGNGRYARLMNVSNTIKREGLSSVLLVNRSEHLLLDLKMARDLGLSAYGSPISPGSFDAHNVLRAGLAYWQYVLLGSA